MTPTVVLVVSTFLASAVEMVEALTIVFALGVTRGWRSATIGVARGVRARSRSSSLPSVPRSPRSRSRRCGSSSARCCWCSACSGSARRSCVPRVSGRSTTRTRSSPARSSDHATRRIARRAARLVRLHALLQGRAPRGTRGGVHRRDLREHGGPHRVGGRRRRAPRWSSSPPSAPSFTGPSVGSRRTRSSSPSGSC